MTVRSTNILMRVSEEDKATIQGFARAAGLGVTDFMLRSAMRCGNSREFRYPQQQMLAVDATEPLLGTRSCFLAACQRAKKGGAGGYAEAGKALYAYALKRNLGCSRSTTELYALVCAEDRDGTRDWFESAFPSLMGYVPMRRRGVFVDGVQTLHKSLRPWEIHA